VPAQETAARIAVLPIENMSGQSVDGRAVEEGLRAALGARGLGVVDPEVLGASMARHRIRYTGGLDPAFAAALAAETGATAALVTSLERFSDSGQPVVSLTLRLVSTTPELRILWIDDAGVTGIDRPGALDLGIVQDSAELLSMTLGRLVDRLASSVGGKPPTPERAQRRFDPRKEYGATAEALARPAVRVVVLPFTNRSNRRRAGDLVALHFVRRLAERPDFVVVEPGLVRQVLLSTRIIPEGGIAFAQADLLKGILGADLVVTGEVLDYVDVDGSDSVPIVDFSVQLLDTSLRRVVWSSYSHNTGTDRVWFFEQGRIRTANVLASQMSMAAVDRMLRAKGKP
jgi:TolB-like protein